MNPLPTNDGTPQVPSFDAKPAPTSACPKCGERQWTWCTNRPGASGFWKCHACSSATSRRTMLAVRAAQRAGHRSNEPPRSQPRERPQLRTNRCPDCKQLLPHTGSNGCPIRTRHNAVDRGRQRINQRWPGYGDLLTDTALLARAGKDWPHVAGYPIPSKLYPGLDRALDDRLRRDDLDKDVLLCQELAKVPKDDQRQFLDLFLINPEDARLWLRLPAWQRPIRKGDADDDLIWRFFTMFRLNMEQAAADAPPWSMASQGAQLPQLFGTIARLSPEGIKRLCSVMSSFGATVKNHQDIGNVMRKPWEE